MNSLASSSKKLHKNKLSHYLLEEEVIMNWSTLKKCILILVLAGDKKAYIASSRGGVYGENSPVDFQEGFLKTVFNFTGVTDVEIIRAEGVNMGPELKDKAIAAALAQVQTI
jgi:hypothetical protein